MGTQLTADLSPAGQAAVATREPWTSGVVTFRQPAPPTPEGEQ